MAKSNSHKFRKDLAAVKIENYKKNGRCEITTRDELLEYPIGSLISFTKKKNIFKLGGFLTKISDDYFTYITPDFEHKFRVKYSNVVKMWAGDVYSTHNDIVSLVKNSKKKTNYPITVDGIIVYYAKNNYDSTRFKCTDRYKRLIAWVNYFLS